MSRQSSGIILAESGRMKPNLTLRSGILVAILAQGATLSACGTDGGEDPVLGDGDGDGDGDCNNTILIIPISVNVLGGVDDEGEACRATAVVSDDEGETTLPCSVVESTCRCEWNGGAAREGMTLTVSDGDTVLFEVEELEDLNESECPDRTRFGTFEVDYVEALGEARNALTASIDSTASPEPCETEADCEALPLGAKACGGPWSYAVVSSGSETYEETLARSEELERIERLYNTLAEVVSDCAYAVAPELACENGVCVGTPTD